MTERKPDDKDTAADFCWAAYSDPEGVYAGLYTRASWKSDECPVDEWKAIEKRSAALDELAKLDADLL